VGHTTPERRAPYVERLSLALLLPRYLLIGQMALMGGFGMAITGTAGLMHYASPPSNPFAVYADVFPGQPIHALDAYGFDCTLKDDGYYEATETHCILSPETGDFAYIEAFYSSNLISRISFGIRDNRFNMAELVGWLDLSEIHQRGGVLFSWLGNIGVARLIHPYKHFSLLRRVWQVTLTDTRYHGP
jgi:hypothetical protein